MLICIWVNWGIVMIFLKKYLLYWICVYLYFIFCLLFKLISIMMQMYIKNFFHHISTKYYFHEIISVHPKLED